MEVLAVARVKDFVAKTNGKEKAQRLKEHCPQSYVTGWYERTDCA